MRLSKASYYADFFVYPAVVAALTCAELRAPSSLRQLDWVLACLVGLAAWTLIEYVVHRFVFHRLPIIAQMHEEHHANPKGLVGSPTWLSLPAMMLGLFLPLWWQTGFDVASGLTTGVMLGYLWYVGVHHAVHHWRINRTSFLYQAKLRHVGHHYGEQEGNFGVTSAVWDRVFGTAIDLPHRKQTRAA